MDLCSWSLELAHVNWGLPQAVASIEESIAIGREYIDEWKQNKQTYVVCALIDDKEFHIPDREAWLASSSKKFSLLFEVLNFVCFESDLVRLKEDFLSQINPRYRSRINREIQRYQSKHGRVACSHDIAIWHLLRLGRLPSGTQFLHWLNANPASRETPFAQQSISILEDEDRDAELRAKEIIKRAAPPDLVRRIVVEYYA